MKYLIFTSLCLTIITTTALAATKKHCPRGTSVIYKCNLNLQPGDSEFFGNTFPKVHICEGEATTALIIFAENDTKVLPSLKTIRMGGTTYSVIEGVDDGALSFSVTTGISNPNNTKGELAMKLPDVPEEFRATYVCKK